MKDPGVAMAGVSTMLRATRGRTGGPLPPPDGPDHWLLWVIVIVLLAVFVVVNVASVFTVG